MHLLESFKFFVHFRSPTVPMQTRKTRILAELPTQLLTSPRAWALGSVIGISLMGVVTAIAVPRQGPSQIVTRAVTESLPTPDAAISAQSDLPFVTQMRVQSGDTAPALFRRLRIDDSEALGFLSETTEGRQALRQLRAGRTVTATVGGDGRLHSLGLPIGGDNGQFVIERDKDGQLQLRKDEASATFTTIVEMRTGEIRSSLFAATDAADLPDEVANKLVELFGTEIDFHTDLRKGDRFNVVYEAIHNRGTAVRSGRVLAAEFINQGKRHVVVLHQRADKEQYYTADGRSLAKPSCARRSSSRALPRGSAAAFTPS